MACRDIFGVEPALLYDQPGFIGNCVHPEDRDGFLRSGDRVRRYPGTVVVAGTHQCRAGLAATERPAAKKGGKMDPVHLRGPSASPTAICSGTGC